MATIESQLSEQVVGALAADALAPAPPVLGLIQADSVVDGPNPKGRTRVTLNWTAPTRNEALGGEMFRLLDESPDLAAGTNGASHETEFDPVVAATYQVYERTATDSVGATLTASTLHGERKAFVQTPVPAAIVTGAWVVVEDTVNAKEEYAKLKAVNTGTGELTFEDGLFFTHSTGAAVKQVTLTVKTEATHYNIALSTGVLTELTSGFTASNKIVIRYQTTLQDLTKYELYRVPGNAPVTNPTRANVLAASGLVTVDNNISGASTSKQDALPVQADAGKDFTYYLFAADSQGNPSSLSHETMTLNNHLVFVEFMPSVPTSMAVQTSTNKVVVSWAAATDPNPNGYNIYRTVGAVFNPATAVKLNSLLIPKGSGTISFDDSAMNVTNRVSAATAPFPLDGQTFSYKVETEDTVTFWGDGTSNVPSLDITASKTAGVGDGTGGR